jgi:hypothetical protein
MSGPYRDPTLNELREKYEKRIAELEAALGAVLGYIPDGWMMPWGFDQIASQACAALRDSGTEGNLPAEEDT